VAPALGDAAALEHDMIDAARRQARAHRKPGLAGADDRNIGASHGSALCFQKKRGRQRLRSMSMLEADAPAARGVRP
jgi:hypothetical protein